jgi:hypothetical protein
MGISLIYDPLPRGFKTPSAVEAVKDAASRAHLTLEAGF